MKFWLAITLLMLGGTATAGSYKCIDQSGKTSFSFTPCPTWVGDSTFQPDAQSASTESQPVGGSEALDRNRRATRIMQQNRSGARTGSLTIVPDNTSRVGKERQSRERNAANEGGQKRRPVVTRCYSSGDYQVSFTNCVDSTGGRSNITTYDGNSTGIYRPGNQ